MDKGLSVVLEGRRLGSVCVHRDGKGASPQIRCREPPPEAACKSRQWIEGRSKPLNVHRQKRRRITERLAGGVKGLTARFDVLLVTIPAVRPSRAARAGT